ncbi:hypothetical protein [Halpernia sp. GG3]
MNTKKEPTKKNEMEISKKNQDFQNIPESSSQSEDKNIKKEDIKKASELNKDGKTDNTEKNK